MAIGVGKVATAVLVVQQGHRGLMEGRHAASEGGGELLPEKEAISEQVVVKGGRIVVGQGVADTLLPAFPRNEKSQHLDVKVGNTLEPVQIAAARVVSSDGLL